MKDSYGRNIDYMRVSVTDKCNLRCSYCMPKNSEFLPDKDILTFDDIIKVSYTASKLGISKIKVTGGEPLVRAGVTDLIKRLKSLQGIKSVTLTTNGVLLERFIDEICNSGVDCVNISLDSLNRENYKKITGCDCLEAVLRGIDALYDRNIPIKINTVLQKGINDSEVFNIISIAKERSIDVRFIEMMPIGQGINFQPVLNSYIINSLGSKLKKTDIKENGPAVYYNIEGYKGKIGFISSVSNRFCSECNRIRLTSTGFLKGCLCYDKGIFLREILRENNYDKLEAALKRVIEEKPKGHCFDNRDKISEKKEMNKIGG